MSAFDRYMLEGLFVAMGASQDAATEAAQTHYPLNRDPSQFRSQCNKCGRKSVTKKRYACKMTQPDGTQCDGVFEELA